MIILNAMNDTKRTERVVLLLTPNELRVVEEFRFSNRIQNRNDAIRELMRRAMPEMRPQAEQTSAA
jgi:metal-responsive CopG/Arc/MetJ family transcriptional regulator